MTVEVKRITITRCDRCGATVEENDDEPGRNTGYCKATVVTRGVMPITRTTADLCPGCTSALEVWLQPTPL